MFGWLSEEAARASCSKRPMRLGVGGELLGQELDRDVAVQVVVARAPDLAHPPRTQPGEKLVASEPHADGGGHARAWASVFGTAGVRLRPRGRGQGEPRPRIGVERLDRVLVALSRITRRLSFRVGVSSPVSTDSSFGSSAIFLIVS